MWIIGSSLLSPAVPTAYLKGPHLHCIGANVNDSRPRLDPVSLDDLRLADGGDHDVGRRTDLGRVLAAGVQHGDGRVAISQQHRDGGAHDVGAADDDGSLAGDLDTGAVKQLQAALQGDSLSA